ncbi:CcmD family protein [Pedobacter helvus]|uniref:CcmD family protein n=1 Tax=Pedobacter helvus TaxID=2563444 RepID=A0ABW9JJW1_9SPHI|nr:CcmD family protein [Pedobacter ureilyticus]
MKKLLTILSLLFASLNLLAQNNDIEMADQLRADGKIYIVVICIAIILAGLLFYLFALDKRLKLLEKKSSGKN